MTATDIGVETIATDGTGATNYSIVTTLEGAAFLLTFAYNQRANCWYLSIATEEGDDIYNGIKLLSNWPLLRKCADPRMPPGEMMSFSNSSDTTPAGLNDLAPGGRCTLVYIESDLLP